MRVRQSLERTVICGRFPVLAYDGTEIDHYQIEVELNMRDLDAAPKVREVGGRIPHTLERHNPAGQACLFVVDEKSLYWNKNTSIVDFIKNGPVRDFFFGQTFFQETGRWPFGERPHGFAGVVDYYLEVLQTKKLEQVINFLELLGEENVPSGCLCYCGKVKWLRTCHFDKLCQIRTIISGIRARFTLHRLLAQPWAAYSWTSEKLKIQTAATVLVVKQKENEIETCNFKPKKKGDIVEIIGDETNVQEREIVSKFHGTNETRYS